MFFFSYSFKFKTSTQKLYITDLCLPMKLIIFIKNKNRSKHRFDQQKKSLELGTVDGIILTVACTFMARGFVCLLLLLFVLLKLHIQFELRAISKHLVEILNSDGKFDIISVFAFSNLYCLPNAFYFSILNFISFFLWYVNSLFTFHLHF